MKSIFFLSLLMSAQLVAATALQVSEFETINTKKIPKTATLGVTALKRVGTGIRQKKVFFVNVNVYQATLLASEPLVSKDPKSALDALLTMKACALRLELLRSLSAADILKSFEAALKINGVKDSPALGEFKAAIKNGGNVATGQSVTISIDKDNSLLTCEQGTNIVQIKGSEKLFREVLSIWLGKPADPGLAALQKKLIEGA